MKTIIEPSSIKQQSMAALSFLKISRQFIDLCRPMSEVDTVTAAAAHHPFGASTKGPPQRTGWS
jgi:hypothetical protein